MADQKETWFCRDCGSLDIRHDAIARYDPELADYVVEWVLDGTWCEDCMQRAAEARELEDIGDPAFGIPGSTEEDDAEEE